MEALIDYRKSNKPKGFTPRPYYSAEGDSLTFYFKDEPSYRERVDDFLTIYKSIDSGRLVGCQIKGLPAALKLLGDFGLLLQDESVCLAMIFMACMAMAPPKASARERYIELGRVAKEREASIPAKELASIVS